MKKLLLILVLIGAWHAGVEAKTVSYINLTGEKIWVKGPYPSTKNNPFGVPVSIESNEAHVAEFVAEKANDPFIVKFMVGSGSMIGIELRTVFPDKDSVLLIKKNEQDKKGTVQDSYDVLKAGRFNPTKTSDARTF